MGECNLFSTGLLILTVIFGISAWIFFRKNIAPELEIISKTGGKENFYNADWWTPTKKIGPDFSRSLRKKGCGWNTGHDIEANCPYNNDPSNDSWPIRQKCSESSLGENECTEEKPYWASNGWWGRMVGGCKWMGKRYPYATDCKGTPNNNCCQKFDRRSGFIGGDGAWCARCKDPRPEDVEFCKGVNTLHCNES
jgi:hypothetical protein